MQESSCYAKAILCSGSPQVCCSVSKDSVPQLSVVAWPQVGMDVDSRGTGSVAFCDSVIGKDWSKATVSWMLDELRSPGECRISGFGPTSA